MSKEVSVLVIGCGNMGASHATAYHNHKGFEICGLLTPLHITITKVLKYVG